MKAWAYRRLGSMKGLIKILPGFDEADKEIEALFYLEPIEPPSRQPSAGAEAIEDVSHEPEH